MGRRGTPRERISTRWYDLQDSLWFVPTLMTIAATLLALALVRLDEILRLDEGQRYRIVNTWAFGGGADGARGVLAAIAGTMITVIGVVYSLTVVSLQLASAQFTPRVLRAFTGDRGNQIVLGCFIGTFTYALLVLRTIRAEDEGGRAFVPSISVTVGIALAFISIGFLIYYIHHIARSIQAWVVVAHAGADTLGLVDEVFPRHGETVVDAADVCSLPDETGFHIRIDSGGYIQSVDEASLRGLVAGAHEGGPLAVRLAVPVGAFLMPGAVLASVWALGPDSHLSGSGSRSGDQVGEGIPDGAPSGAPAVDRDWQEVEDVIRGAVAVGSERTLQNDVDLGIRQLADIALKSLSPSINDPTTATICLDRLGEALVEVGRRPERDPIRRGDGGRGLLVFPGPSRASLVTVAFSQIRHYGAADVALMEHLVVTLGRIVENTPPACHAPLLEEARLALQSARQGITLPGDVARVERAAAWLARPPLNPPSAPDTAA